MKSQITIREWLSLGGSILIGAISLTAYAYTTFQTKEAAHRHEDRIVQRLDQMEEKIIEALKR